MTKMNIVCFLLLFGLLFCDGLQPAAVNAVADESAPETPSIRQQPVVLKSNDHGVGRLIPDLVLTDLAGQSHRLSDFRNSRAVVIAMTGTACPLCLKYAPSLARIERQYQTKNVTFIFVTPGESESTRKIQEAIDSHGFQGLCVQDARLEVCRTLGVSTTTEVLVLDAAGTLMYRGAVDDQYGLGYSLNEPRRTFLTDALDAVLEGQLPEVGATSAPGCELFYDNSATAEPETAISDHNTVTYHNTVSRIIQANCIECHRGAGIAPLPLETYQQVKDYAGMIRSVVERRIMPPWFAAPLPEPEQSDSLAPHWANERSLSAADRNDLLAWISAGAPEGDAADAPLPRQFPDGWLIGQPDVVFEFPEPVQVKATGTMPYQNVEINTELSEDRWVQAIEVRPGNPQVVHHVLVFADSPDSEGSGRRRVQDERTDYWGIYVPGNSTLTYPDGFAKKLPKGATLRFQMHYTPNGTATEDSTRIGLVFSKQPPRHEVKVAGVVNTKLSIPPGADNHQEVATLKLPFDAQLLGFLPHMHLRGKAARYEAVTSSETTTLLDIPRYDFNWQLLYRLSEPLTLHAGDTIRFTAWFDNSAANPANPDPSRTVGWGPQTEDEMHLGYVEYFVPGAKPGETPEGMRRAQAAGAVRAIAGQALFNRLDVNGDGVVTRAEVREKMPDNPDASGKIFDRLDQNGNDELDKSEFSRLEELRR